jgi:diadenosine tetraphosphate (Ap4A) HIT family hydrolase
MHDFTEIDPKRILFQNKLFFIVRDGFPVSPGHLLIISNTLRNNFFDLTKEEQGNLSEVIEIAKGIIEKEFQPDGYNIGMNCGAAAGQTIFHFHCHVIPRYTGDMEDPRGGVRNCIPSKGNYMKS